MDREAVLLGFVKAGKTTYLAALWQSLRAKGCPLACTLDALPADRKYLTDISEKWLRAAEMPHSPLGEPKMVELSLRIEATSEELRLRVPDLSGELYLDQLRDRQFSVELTEIARQCSGFLLFVNPAEVKPPTLIEDGLLLLDRLASQLGGSGGQAATTERVAQPQVEVDGRSGTAQAWDFSQIAPDAALVELLQAIEFVRPPEKETRISILISAWDQVRAFFSDPEEYVRRQLPLLWQYINRESRVKYVLFGISAQGGDYLDAIERQALLRMQPWERVRVVGGRGDAPDVLTPIMESIFKPEP